LAIETAITTAAEGAEFDWTGALRAGLRHVADSRRSVWEERIEEALAGDPSRWHETNGWVVAAFQAAIAAITSAAAEALSPPDEHLASALRAASRSGGDTDTVAAIAGALLGARWGAAAIPPEWRAALHGRRTYDQPAAITGADLERLAHHAAREGSVTRDG
jgi:ADP-ribosylglycohydrolase